MSLNKVMIIGRLGADPEMKTLSSGNSLTTFSIATSENWKDKDGQKQEKTEWHRIVVWGKLAEICGKYLAKGREAYIEGKLQTRSWEDQQGQKRYTTEIVAANVQFLGGQAQANSNYDSQQQDSQDPFSDFAPEPDFNTSGDEIPF
jgi:single-strand DNA-binding protein